MMFYFNPYSIPPLLASILILALGLFVWLKRIKSMTNFSWFLFCFSLFIWLFSDFFLFLTNDNNLAAFLSRLVYVGVTGIPISLLYFGLKITKTPIRRYFLWSMILLFFITIIILFKTNLIIDGCYEYFWGLYTKAGKQHYIYLLIWISLSAITSAIIYKKTLDLRISSTEKLRLRYVFFALLIAFLIGSTDFVQKYGIEFYPIGYFCVPPLICFITYAIFRHQLLGIEVVFKKGLLYSLLIGALTGIYLLIIMLTEWLFRGILGYKSLFISLSAAFIIAILFNPLRDKLQAFVDKLFLGKTQDEVSKENELLRQELERSERLKTAGTMALGLAHEIKNPLATIKTFSEFLPDKCLDGAFVNNFSRLVPAEVKRINDIVQNLLDFSKPSPPSFQEVDINEVISDVLDISSNEFLSRRIELIKSFEEKKLVIKADPNQIKQVIINLIFNAMEAMPKGGSITVTTKRLRDDAVKIEVADTGSGIPQENLKNIFSPFFTTKDKGAGLGLSIVHQIIKNHKGLIEIKSEVGVGTKITIELSS